MSSEKSIVPAKNNPSAVIETSLGTITVELDDEKAPVTVSNFISYANDGFYNGTIFHRVIKGFMIQGGGFDNEMKQKRTKPPVKNEADNGFKNLRGTLAMARTNVVDSATSQFFINSVDNDFLNHTDKSPQGYGYTVFGKVVKGIEVVDLISSVKTGSYGLFRDVPVDPVIIISVEIKHGQEN